MVLKYGVFYGRVKRNNSYSVLHTYVRWITNYIKIIFKRQYLYCSMLYFFLWISLNLYSGLDSCTNSTIRGHNFGRDTILDTCMKSVVLKQCILHFDKCLSSFSTKNRIKVDNIFVCLDSCPEIDNRYVAFSSKLSYLSKTRIL